MSEKGGAAAGQGRWRLTESLDIRCGRAKDRSRGDGGGVSEATGCGSDGRGAEVLSEPGAEPAT